MLIVLTLFAAMCLGPMFGMSALVSLAAGALVLVADLGLRVGSRSFWPVVVLDGVAVLAIVALKPQREELLHWRGVVPAATVWSNF